jgi:phosphoenolpyruvate carboxykinase (ATP)
LYTSYAKVADLSEEAEPDIYRAMRFGAVLENVIYDAKTREVDYTDTSLTKNTRGSYPIEFIDKVKMPCRGGHPGNVIFLTCDAFGVLPPVSRLSAEQAMVHFMSGYTAKVAGTEMGVTEPEATFSPCFGGPFLVWHPKKYAELLRDKLARHSATTWLVNTGWSGGPYGVGRRIALKHTRAIVAAIHDGSLAQAETVTDPVFGLQVPTSCADVPREILQPRSSWGDPAAYDRTAGKLARLFRENLEKLGVSKEFVAAGPLI